MQVKSTPARPWDKPVLLAGEINICTRGKGHSAQVRNRRATKKDPNEVGSK